MAGNGDEREGEPIQRSQCVHFTAQVVLRILACFVTLSATLVTALSKQTMELAGFSIEASYKVSPALRFFVVGNAVVCGYSFFSVPFALKLLQGWLFHLLDLMIMGLSMAAASAATAFAYIAKKGNDQIGWMEVCSYYEKFCTRVGISLACSYAGFLLFLLICFLPSVHKAKAK